MQLKFYQNLIPEMFGIVLSLVAGVIIYISRIGFENNLTMPDGSIAKNNAALVANAAGIVLEARRKIASADDLRQLLS